MKEGRRRPWMSGTHQTSAATGAQHTGAPLTRPQRQELLRLLLVGRGLERVLASLRGRLAAASSGETDAVLAAIAAGTGLGPDDRLVVPHGLLAAHLAGGIGAAEVAAARLGERSRQQGAAGRRLRAALGPQSSAGIAVGTAFALHRSGRHDAAVALIDRRWAEEQECRSALALARELNLPLVVVAIDSGQPAEAGSPIVDRRDFEAVRTAVAAAIDAAHADRGPSLVVCAANQSSESRAESHVTRFTTRVDDPVIAYERWLMINGFSRAELDGVRRSATQELDQAVGGRIGAVREQVG
jgi:TPP-dependent pyruvate/acetoin dehydrogenase alpha subunit